MTGTLADKVVVQRQAKVNGRRRQLRAARLRIGNIPTLDARLRRRSIGRGRRRARRKRFFQRCRALLRFHRFVCHRRRLRSPRMRHPRAGHRARFSAASQAIAELLGIVEHPNRLRPFKLQTWLDRKIDDLGWKFGAVALGGFLATARHHARMLSTFGARAMDRTRASGPSLFVRPLHSSLGRRPYQHPHSTAAMDAAAREAKRALFAKNHYAKVSAQRRRGRRRARLQRVSIRRRPSPPTASTTLTCAPTSIAPINTCIVHLANCTFARGPPTWRVPNLHFAGDWTRNGIDVPCMEGVVVSALYVAEAIIGRKTKIFWPNGIGFETRSRRCGGRNDARHPLACKSTAALP